MFFAAPSLLEYPHGLALTPPPLPIRVACSTGIALELQNRPDPDRCEHRRFILGRRGCIVGGRRIAFDAALMDRDTDPIGQVRDIYESLALPEFRQVEPGLRRYVESLSGYKKNTLPELSPDLRERKTALWTAGIPKMDR